MSGFVDGVEVEIFELTGEQFESVVETSGLPRTTVQGVLDGIDDVLHADPPGTIRRSPNGTVLAVRMASIQNPWLTFSINGGSNSWNSTVQSVLTWPVIAGPVERGARGGRA